MTDKTTTAYPTAQPIFVAVDSVVFGFDVEEEKLKVLLFRRQIEPMAGQWSLVGSFVRPDESAETAASRILTDFTGLKSVFLEQLKCYSEVHRDSADRVISLAYYSLIQIKKYRKAVVKKHDAAWFDLLSIPDLVLDHREMIGDALRKLQENARHQPLGFNLLSAEFTLPQLIKLYQEIYQKKIDDRNFRKKILSTGLLERLDSKDKSTSKKGAYLYRFNKQKYTQLQTEGYYITFH